jgi:hypothetical protein
VIPDPRYQRAYDGILAWMLDNPVRTQRWENIFDDTRYMEPYANQATMMRCSWGGFSSPTRKTIRAS